MALIEPFKKEPFYLSFEGLKKQNFYLKRLKLKWLYANLTGKLYKEIPFFIFSKSWIPLCVLCSLFRPLNFRLELSRNVAYSFPLEKIGN